MGWKNRDKIMDNSTCKSEYDNEIGIINYNYYNYNVISYHNVIIIMYNNYYNV